VLPILNHSGLIKVMIRLQFSLKLSSHCGANFCRCGSPNFVALSLEREEARERIALSPSLEKESKKAKKQEEREETGEVIALPLSLERDKKQERGEARDPCRRPHLPFLCRAGDQH
jgi:hypothetical protein